MTALLAGRDLCLIRGDRCLFDGLEFDLDAGALLSVEGPNGSGKTSLLRAIAGLLSFDDGEIRWQGTTVHRAPQSFHSNVVWMGHRTGLKGDLTLLENLRFEAGLRAMSSPATENVCVKLGLTELRELPCRILSAGQQRRVALARMLLSEARLWFMDEPFTNLDTAGQQVVVELLQQHLATGGLCVLASHRVVTLEAPVHRIRL